jgi:hypothetical protein
VESVVVGAAIALLAAVMGGVSLYYEHGRRRTGVDVWFETPDGEGPLRGFIAYHADSFIAHRRTNFPSGIAIGVANHSRQTVSARAVGFVTADSSKKGDPLVFALTATESELRPGARKRWIIGPAELARLKEENVGAIRPCVNLVSGEMIVDGHGTTTFA